MCFDLKCYEILENNSILLYFYIKKVPNIDKNYYSCYLMRVPSVYIDNKIRFFSAFFMRSRNKRPAHPMTEKYAFSVSSYDVRVEFRVYKGLCSYLILYGGKHNAF